MLRVFLYPYRENIFTFLLKLTFLLFELCYNRYGAENYKEGREDVQGKKRAKTFCKPDGFCRVIVLESLLKERGDYFLC